MGCVWPFINLINMICKKNTRYSIVSKRTMNISEMLYFMFILKLFVKLFKKNTVNCICGVAEFFWWFAWENGPAHL